MDNNNEEENLSCNDARLVMGEAYMFCNNCGARLYSFDGNQDASRNCPKMKNNRCGYDD